MGGNKRPLEEWRDAIWTSELPAMARWTAVTLSRYMDFKTLGRAFPGKDQLAAKTGLSMKSVKRQLALLKESGWIDETHKGGGRGHASAYRGTYPKGVTVTPFITQTGSQRTINGVTEDHKGGHSDPPPWSNHGHTGDAYGGRPVGDRSGDAEEGAYSDELWELATTLVDDLWRRTSDQPKIRSQIFDDARMTKYLETYEDEHTPPRKQFVAGHDVCDREFVWILKHLSKGLEEIVYFGHDY